MSGGNPITEDTYTYDITHATSVAFDSYTLASASVDERRLEFLEGIQAYVTAGDGALAGVYGEIVSTPDEEEAVEAAQIQHEIADFVYWIYEATNTDGCYSADGE